MKVLSFIYKHVPEPELDPKRAVGYYHKKGYPTHSMLDFYFHKVRFDHRQGPMILGLSHNNESKSGQLALRAEKIYETKFKAEVDAHITKKNGRFVELLSR